MLTQKTNPNLTPTQKGNLLSFLNDYTVDARLKNELRDSLKKAGLDLGNIQPKYDPTRLFKKGDRVRIVKYNGRKFDAAPPTFQLGKVYRVDEDEDTEHCYVMLQSCDLYYAHPVAFLELVTPVEELEPYSVQETMSHDGWQIVRDGLPLAIYDSRRHPNAKAAAEAERDRLNAEYRKEQNNG